MLNKSMRIIEVTERHVDDVWQIARSCALGQQQQPQDGFLLTVDREHYAHWAERAVRFDAVEHKGALLAFMLIAASRDLPADGCVNVLPRPPAFEVKQAGVLPLRRRSGLASALYDHALPLLPAGDVGATIIHDPYNAASVAFHSGYGFELAASMPASGKLRAYGLYVRPSASS